MAQDPNPAVTLAGSGVLLHVLNPSGEPIPVAGTVDGAIDTSGGGGGGGGAVTQSTGATATPWYMQGVNGGVAERLATAAKQPAIGTAGTPSADVASVQGVAGGTAIPTSNAAATQADGHSATIGATTDADTAITLIGRVKNLLSRIPAALVGGRFDGNIGSWFGATTPTVGQKVATASIPVVIASDLRTQSQFFPVRLTDGTNFDITQKVQGPNAIGGAITNPVMMGGQFSGVSIVFAGDSGNRQLVAGAAASGAAVAGNPVLTGGSDGTNARTLKMDTSGRPDVTLQAWLGSTAPTVGQKAMSASLPVAIASDQTAVSIKDVIWEISSTGLYQGRVARNTTLIGRRTTFVAGVLNDLGQFTLPSAAGAQFGIMTATEALEIVSSSANDAAAGTGARTVKITYIDALGAETSTTVTMNGTTPVSLGAIRMLAVQYMEVVTNGSGLTAAGNITLRTVTVGTQWEMILAAYNRSMSAQYMVPVGFTAYLVYASMSARNQAMDVELLATMLEDGMAVAAFGTHNAIDIPSNSESNLVLPLHSFPASTRIKWAAVPGAVTGSPRCQVSWSMLVISNT